jgi:hypothetical protein
MQGLVLCAGVVLILVPVRHRHSTQGEMSIYSRRVSEPVRSYKTRCLHPIMYTPQPLAM